MKLEMSTNETIERGRKINKMKTKRYASNTSQKPRNLVKNLTLFDSLEWGMGDFVDRLKRIV
jgi:hypothetical protein